MYLWNRRSDNRTHTAKMSRSSIPTSQTTDMVRRNIITPEAVWEERSTREDSWLHSAGWLIRVIKRTRRRRRLSRCVLISMVLSSILLDISFFKVCKSFLRSPIVVEAILQEEKVKHIIDTSSLPLFAANNASNIFGGIFEQSMQYHCLHLSQFMLLAFAVLNS